MSNWKILLGCLGSILSIPVVIILCFASWTLTHEDVGEEALNRTRRVLTDLQQQPFSITVTSSYSNAPYPLDLCKEFLSSKIASFGRQYTIELLAAYDANDPDYAIEGLRPPIGNREATVLVKFPDDEGTVLYWYNGFWEGCWHQPDLSTLTPVHEEE